MHKQFKTLSIALWSVLLVYTLCTVGYLKEIKNDLLRLETDIQELQYSMGNLEQTVTELTIEIDELNVEVADLKTQIEQIQTYLESKPIEPELPFTDEEINLIALVAVAESEGEPEEGQRLVIDTILNRVESGYSYWPDTVTGVVYQPSQFSSMWDGRADRCRVTDEMVQLVKEELKSRTNTEVVYFRVGHYSPYGTPMFQVGNHYFSSI